MSWSDFGDLDLIFKVTAVEKLKIHSWGTSVFSENTITSFCFVSGSKAPVKPVPTIPTSSDSEYTQQDNFMCEKCDKMYTRARDLDIHMSYCTG